MIADRQKFAYKSETTDEQNRGETATVWNREEPIKQSWTFKFLYNWNLINAKF